VSEDAPAGPRSAVYCHEPFKTKRRMYKGTLGPPALMDPMRLTEGDRRSSNRTKAETNPGSRPEQDIRGYFDDVQHVTRLRSWRLSVN